MNSDDFVFYRDDENNICSGGFRINNAIKKLDMPALFGNRDPLQVGGSQLPLNDLVIPSGLVLLQRYMSNKDIIPEKPIESVKDDSPISGDLYSRLLELVQVKKIKEPKTRKRRKKKKKMTRRRR